MSDKRIRELERRVAAGDPDAQRELDAQRIRICEHEPQSYATIGELRPELTVWCKLCGVCMSDPTRDPNPAGLRAQQEFDDLINTCSDAPLMPDWSRRVSENLQIDGPGCPIEDLEHP